MTMVRNPREQWDRMAQSLDVAAAVFQPGDAGANIPLGRGRKLPHTLTTEEARERQQQ